MSTFQIQTAVRLDEILPRTPFTPFEKLLFLNRLNQSALAEYPARDPTQLHIIPSACSLSDVTVYSNPVFNQDNFLANTAFDQLEVWLVDTWELTPAQVAAHGVRVSGRSGFTSSNLVNGTIVAEVDFTSQIARASTGVSLPRRVFPMVWIRGQTGSVIPDSSYLALHVRLKLFSS